MNIFVSRDWQHNSQSVINSMHPQTWCRILKHKSLSHIALTAWEYCTERHVLTSQLLLCLQVMVEIAPIFWWGQHSQVLVCPLVKQDSSSRLLPNPSQGKHAPVLLSLVEIEHSLQVLRANLFPDTGSLFSCSATRYLHCSHHPSLLILLTCLLLTHH